MLHGQTVPFHHVPTGLPGQHRNHEDNILEHSLSGSNSKVETKLLVLF